MDMEIPNFDNLFMKDLRGNIREWTIGVEPSHDGTARIITTAGIIGKKYTNSTRHIQKGKNIGKANETTPLQQAISEAQSMWQKRVDAGMLPNRTAAESHEPVFPMLAHRFDGHSKKIRYPAYVQPKLDGIRCISCIENGQVRLISRKNKDFNFLEHIREAIAALDLRNGLYLDGELFTKDLSFEEIVGLCRKDKRITDKERQKMLKIEYHIYDCFDIHDKKLPFELRHEIFYEYLKKLHLHSPLKLVETRVANNEEEVKRHYDDFYGKQNYEGAMIRNAKDSPYGINKRSYDLQKIKEFEDAEFKIIGFKEATGNDSGTIVWLCQNENGFEFDVRPKATREARAELFQQAQRNFNQFKGKQLTVQFQGLTNGGVPRFPVGIGIRDYE